MSYTKITNVRISSNHMRYSINNDNFISLNVNLFNKLRSKFILKRLPCIVNYVFGKDMTKHVVNICTDKKYIEMISSGRPIFYCDENNEGKVKHKLFAGKIAYYDLADNTFDEAFSNEQSLREGYAFYLFKDEKEYANFKIRHG